MKKRILWSLLILAASGTTFQSCSDDSPAPDPTAALQKLAEGYAYGAATRVELYAREQLFPGYNPVFISLFDSISGTRLENATVRLNPIMTMATMSHSCPVENPTSSAINKIFPGNIVFTMPSGEMGHWDLEVFVENPASGLSGQASLSIEVVPTTPSRVVSFQAENGARYYVSYHFPEKLKVGVNAFDVVVFTLVSGLFVPEENFKIALEPEMPSMDHGSPNNQDPIHTSNGHYSGKVNFTMTGEWRLHLDLHIGGTPLGSKYFDVLVP